jgi:large subunit ribosomal protein L23
MFRRTSASTTGAGGALLTFWRPPHRGDTPGRFAESEGRVEDIKRNLWMYAKRPMDPKPIPPNRRNPYFGPRRIWNAIPSRAGVISRKVEEWGYPARDPPHTGIRKSREYFPFFLDRYFPDAECRLVLDSVLNNETTTPQFVFPCEMSKQEIVNYLRNIYGIENIVSVQVRNVSGRRWKNELGFIRQAPDTKLATVMLDAPVKIDFKQVKGTEDGTS